MADLLEVSRPEKTLYDYVPVGSRVERAFARGCEEDARVKLYFKLSRAFKISTPRGSHHPGWAVVVVEGGRKLFFVVETRGASDARQLGDVERLKIRCGERHFAALGRPDVFYRLAVAGDDWRGAAAS